MSVSTQQGDGGAAVTVSLEGNLDVTAAGALYDRLRNLAAQRQLASVRVDFSAVAAIDSAGVAALSSGQRLLESAGKRVELAGLSAAHRAALALQSAAPGAEPSPPPRVGIRQALANRARAAWQTLLALAELAVDVARGAGRCLTRRERAPLGPIAEQSVLIGVDALPIVAMLSFLLGLVLGFQSIFQLSKFGAEPFMAEVVALSMVREFGPLITAIILAGRSGAAMAAELGTMGVNEETDALRTMGISPVRYLVLPRLVGITLVQPPLTLLSMALGIGGGLLIAFFEDMPWVAIYDRMLWNLTPGDLWLGLLKSVLFAWVIGLAGCFMGMHTRGGARSVGAAATRAVVASIFFVIVIDSIVTTAWTMGHYE